MSHLALQSARRPKTAALAALGVAVIFALVAAFPTFAFASDGEVTYDDDGTVLAPTEGIEALGFSPSRSLTQSDDRGDVDPAGPTLMVSPSELAMMGITRSPDGSADGIGTYNIPSRDVSRSLSYNIAYKHVGDFSAAAEAKALIRGPGAVQAIDINGDGLDEQVQYYYSCDRNNGNNGRMRLTVYNEYGKVYFDFDLDVDFNNSISRTNTGWDVYNKYPQQSWSSIFTFCVGDFNADGIEDVCLLYSYLDGTTAAVDRVTYYFTYDKTTDAYGYACNKQRVSTVTGVQSSFHGYEAASMAVVDINGDGADEVVYTLANASANTTQMWLFKSGVGATSGTDELVPLSGLTLDKRAMLSVSPGDIDNDGEVEIVVGGYSGQELHLAYLECDRQHNHINGALQGTTLLLDDTGMHAVAAGSLQNHGDADTSQYLSEPDSDYRPNGEESHARYVNTTNWTVPLQTVSLTGYQGTDELLSSDQVFFGMWFYSFDTETRQFRPFGDTANLPFKYYDDNNLSILSMTPMIPDGVVNALSATDLNNYMGQQCLLITLSRDLDKKHGSDMAYETYLYFADGTHVDRYTVEVARADYYDRTLYPKMCALNCDDDTLYLKLREHQFAYTEAFLSGVVMAPPYFRDLEEATGYDSGWTSYTTEHSDATEAGGTATVEFGGSFSGKLGNVKMGPTFLGSFEGEWSDTSTTEYAFTLSTSHGEDSAAIHCIPSDIYIYDTYTYNMSTGAFDPGSPLTLSFPCEPVTLMLPLDSSDSDYNYRDRSAAYNAWVNKQNEGKPDSEKLELLPDISEFLNHTAGDPSTYQHKVSGISGVYEGNTLMAVDYSNGFGITSQGSRVSFSDSHSAQYGGAVSIGVVFERDGWLSKGEIEASVKGSGFKGTVTTDGTSYESAVLSIDNDFKDYYYAARMYAGTKKPAHLYKDTKDNDRSYTIIDFVTTNVHCAPAAARDYAAQAAGSEAMNITCTLPWDVPASWNADSYYLEYFDTATQKWAVVENTTVLDPGTSAPQEWTFKHEKLNPDTSYQYHIVSTRGSVKNYTPSFTGKTESAPLHTVSMTQPAHGEVWGYRVDDEGSLFSIEGSGDVQQGAEVRSVCIPEEGYEVSGWRIERTSDGTVFTEDDFSVDGGVLTIPEVTFDATVTPIVENVSGAALAEESEGAEGDEAIEPLAQDAPRPDLDAAGVTLTYDPEGAWTTNPDARILVNFSPETLAHAFSYLSNTLVTGAVQSGEARQLIIDNLPNGDYVLPFVVHANGKMHVREVHIKKDAGLIGLDVGLIERYDTSLSEKRAYLVTSARPGASGLVALQMAPGRDVDPATEGVWQDASRVLSEGWMPVDSGWWTVRLMNGAGQTVTKSFEVPEYPKAGLVEPGEPGGPDTPGGDGTTPGGTPGSGGPNSGQVAYPLGGDTLAPTGDSLAAPLSLALLALVAIGTAGAAGIKRRRAQKAIHIQPRR